MLQLKSFFQEKSYQKYKMWFNECSILKNCLRTLENKYDRFLENECMQRFNVNACV